MIPTTDHEQLITAGSQIWSLVWDGYQAAVSKFIANRIPYVDYRFDVISKEDQNGMVLQFVWTPIGIGGRSLSEIEKEYLN